MFDFRCKMCGGTIEFEPGATVGVCDSCGSKQTLPRPEDDNKANLYNRANHFRRQCEFDKALNAYEKLLEKDDRDAEAHWGAVISRYGIEYVEDPATHRRVPTCHRVQVTSILADEDYLAAVENAPDTDSRILYKEQAAEIAEIQRGILAISQNEKPYDVFICYKETDENGARTRDSQWAQDVYYGLTEQGYKVFFSRITLEDKLGQQYEPYIFAALNSAKVMLVIGSKPEYFNAVWVKNEWSRYLALMEKDRHRILIPCYRGMDPYDLPEELSSLQSQDMGKIGFMQDLLRGVKKIVSPKEEAKPERTVAQQTVTQQAPAAGTNIAPLLKRAFMFLEDENWQSADEYCEKVLDRDPENAEAYLGKLMAELRVPVRAELKNCAQPFDGRMNYKKVFRFGNEKLKDELTGYIKFINDRNENARLTGIYNNAVRAMNAANTESAYKTAADTFLTVRSFKDAEDLAKACMEKAEEERIASEKKAKEAQIAAEKKENEELYDAAVYAMDTKEYAMAITIFNILGDFMDSNEKLQECISCYCIWMDEHKLLQPGTRYGAIYETKVRADMKTTDAQKALENAIDTYKMLTEREQQLPAEINQLNQELSRVRGLFGNLTKRSLEKNIAQLTKEKEGISCKIQESKEKITLAKKKLEIAEKELSKAQSEYNEAIIIAAEKAVETAAAEAAAYRAQFDAGKIVAFGNYGGETIKWQVLGTKDDYRIMMSVDALAVVPFNRSQWSGDKWASSSIRKWLNESFYRAAFTEKEQRLIQTTKTTTKPYKKDYPYSGAQGSLTEDKVYLLSVSEVQRLLNNETRICYPTDYAKANGAWVGNTGACWWWLRSPGYADTGYTDGGYEAAIVNEFGKIDESGRYVNNPTPCVRPVITIRLP